MATVTPTYPADEQAVDAEVQDELWMDAINTVTGRAYERMPEQFDVIKDAYNLVTTGQVESQAPNGFLVASGLDKGQTHYTVNGKCNCPGWGTAPNGICVHKLATMIWTRATQLLTPQTPAPQESQPDTPSPAQEVTPSVETPAVQIPAHYLAEIQGKQFILFGGLLTLAHERGLVSLAADWSFNDADLSLAHAVATFNDGRRFEESGDASPGNVGTKIKAHFRRMALTRAKARVLRDALGIDMAAAEELAD